MIWFARATWLALPLTTGGALQDALDPWSSAPATVAALLAWAAWAAALVALLSPRPWGFTLLRVAAPAALVLSITSLPGAGAAQGAAAIVSAAVACVLALSGPVATAAAQAAAYGEERRFPLRAPFGLLVGPLPAAVLVVAGGMAAGPILLADGRPALGLPAVLVGGAALVLLGRSIHTLDTRWLVLVPAGIVVADPLTLADPVLLLREKVGSVARVTTTKPGPETLDLRLGSAPDSVAIELLEPATLVRRRGARRAEVAEARSILVSPLRPAAFLAALNDPV